METKIGAIADVHYLDFNNNASNSENLVDKKVLSTIQHTGDNVIKFTGKKENAELSDENTESMVKNNEKALGKQIPHRFSISQTLIIVTDGIEKTVEIEMIEDIGLSIEEIEKSELETLVDVAREKFITKILNNEYINDKFDISKESNFKFLGTVGINGFIPSERNYLKEM